MWGKIGKDQWVSMRYITLDNTTETTAPATTVPETTAPKETESEEVNLTGKVKSSTLKVRKGAGSSYAVVKTLKKGAKVTVTEQKQVSGLMWGKIGKNQWVSMRHITLNNTTETTAPATTVPETTAPKETEPNKTTITGKVNASGGLAVRKGAGSSYAVKKYLSNGTKVTITEVKEVKGTKWGKISSGWVCMDYIVLDGQNDNNGNVKTVTAECLNVRKSASSTAKIVGYYYKGAKVTILETKKVSGTTWGKTSKGWISMKYVK